MDVNTLYGVLVAVVLSMVIMFFQSLKRKKSWEGTVTDIQKIEEEDSDGFPHIHYKVYYRTDSGKQGKVDLPDRYYGSHFSTLGIGARLIKIAGKDYPELLN